MQRSRDLPGNPVVDIVRGVRALIPKDDLRFRLGREDRFLRFFALRVTVEPKIPAAVVPRRVFTQPGSITDMPSRSSEVRSYPNIRHRSTHLGRQLCAMCGRLRVGKMNLHVAGLVGAAMCSACWCGSHDRWP